MDYYQGILNNLTEEEIAFLLNHFSNKIPKKQLFKNSNISENKYYSEVHHIWPLGKPHNGSDTLDNMVCVCPNCHTLLDYKAIHLNKEIFKVLKHNIADANIKYHNTLNVKWNQKTLKK